MLNMSTMSYIKLRITVFQEQQNGETNVSGLLTIFKHHWLICGGSWPKSHHLALRNNLGHARRSLPVQRKLLHGSLPPARGHGHPRPGCSCHLCPALADRAFGRSPAPPWSKGSASQLPTLTPLRQVVGKLWSASPARAQFFYLKNHLSCYTTRQKSLRLW